MTLKKALRTGRLSTLLMEKYLVTARSRSEYCYGDQSWFKQAAFLRAIRLGFFCLSFFSAVVFLYLFSTKEEALQAGSTCAFIFSVMCFFVACLARKSYKEKYCQADKELLKDLFELEKLTGKTLLGSRDEEELNKVAELNLVLYAKEVILAELAMNDLAENCDLRCFAAKRRTENKLAFDALLQVGDRFSLVNEKDYYYSLAEKDDVVIATRKFKKEKAEKVA